MRKVPVRPKPSRALDVDAHTIDDYDDGDPYSCIAAGAAEDRAKAAAAKAMAALRIRVESCMGQPENRLDELVAEDAASVKAILYDLWYDCRFIRAGKSDIADWAAGESARIGNTTMLDYDAAR